MDQICGILIKDTDSLKKERGVLDVINKPDIVKALQDLVAKEYKASLLDISAQVPTLKSASSG